MPHHKGSEGLQKEVKTKIAKYKELAEKEKKQKKGSGKSLEELRNEYSFDDENNLILVKDVKTPDIFMKELVADWANSGYEEKNRINFPKNTKITK